MKLLYLNPNSTASMTEAVVIAARAALAGTAPGTEILGWTNAGAPPAIQGPEDGAAAVPGLLAQLPRARAEAVDAIVIACFDDTGLDEMRAAAHCPVLGIGQSAYAMAGLLGLRFSVVTTLAVSVPVIEGNIRRLGFAPGCASVRASGLPVLAVDAGGPEVCARLTAEAEAARRDDGAEAVVLGCAGMAHLHAALSETASLPLIDGVAASARLALAAAQTVAGSARG
ncbi:aspartate/glutamate racemase family protein [Paenirhodobacter enshiensis]|uniref:aspartate/glutamate racemase family protein n=1 Tax=Paenirhodobacter enshiensis TaxID=1105367 RepID=UPI0035AFDD1C